MGENAQGPLCATEWLVGVFVACVLALGLLVFFVAVDVIGGFRR